MIQRVIHDAGLSRIKARQIKSLLRRLTADFGSRSGQALQALDTGAVEAYLTSLPGVGLKTARCVMLYSLDRDVFPVDTHCMRLCQNIGLIERRMRFECAQEPPAIARSERHSVFVACQRGCARSRDVYSWCAALRRVPHRGSLPQFTIRMSAIPANRHRPTAIDLYAGAGGLSLGLVEQHLMACDACWQEFQRLEAAVRTVRFDATVRPTLPVHDVVSLLGMSERLERPFGGHTRYLLAVGVLYGLAWMTAVWTELVYAYHRFGTLAWMLSFPTAAWVTGVVLWGLRSDAKATAAGRTNGLMQSTIVLLGALAALVVCLVWVLPAEPTILTSFQTRTASGGFLKDALFICSRC